MTNATSLLALASATAVERAIVPRRFSRYDRVTIDGIFRIPVSKTDNGQVMRRLDDPKLCETFTHAELDSLHAQGRLKIERNYFHAAKAELRSLTGDVSLLDLTQRARNEAIYRYRVCDRALQLKEQGLISLSDASLTIAIKTIRAELLDEEEAKGRHSGRPIPVMRKFSPRTLRRWLKQYEACGFEPMSLCDRYALSGDRTPRLPLEERQIMDAYAEQYLSTLKPSMASLYSKLKGDIAQRNKTRRAKGQALLRIPSRAAFERVIAKMDPMKVYAAREGEEAAKKKFAIVNGGLQVSRPLERIELDEWKIQLQSLLVDAGVWKTMTAEERKAVGTHRFWLVTAIDSYSRCILSARVVREVSAAATIAAVAMAMSDKSAYAEAAGCASRWDEGTDAGWEIACNDAGSALIADDALALYLGLGIRHHVTPAGVPWLRARKERFYRTIHEMLVALFEGRTFADIFEKGDYDGQARASVTADVLGRAIVRWIVDVYQNKPHDGLGGRTPRNVYRDGVREHGILPAPDADQARALFGTTVKRRITNSGVRFLGLNYQSLALQKARRDAGQKPVLVRIDPANLGHVSVRTKDGWLTVACNREGFEGVPVQRWVAAQAVLRRKYADEAKLTEDVVFAAMREIRAMADEAAQRAGIASPILSGVDYDKFERLHFRTFDIDSAVGEAVDIEDLLFDAEATDVSNAQTGSSLWVPISEPATSDGDEDELDDGEGFFTED